MVFQVNPSPKKDRSRRGRTARPIEIGDPSLENDCAASAVCELKWKSPEFSLIILLQGVVQHGTQRQRIL